MYNVEFLTQVASPVSITDAIAFARVDEVDGTEEFLLDTAASIIVEYTRRNMLDRQATLYVDYDQNRAYGSGVSSYAIANNRSSFKNRSINDRSFYLLPYFAKSILEVRIAGEIIAPSTYKIVKNNSTFIEFENTIINILSFNETQVEVDYISGYGDESDVPNAMKMAVKMVFAQMYLNRGECTPDSIVKASGAALILQPYMLYNGLAI